MKLTFRLTVSFLAIALLAPSAGVAANKPNWHLGDRTLRQGVEGHDVKVLQQFLGRAGQRTEIDGVFGSGTKRVVRAFERAQRLRVDGKVTTADVRVLRDVAINGSAVASAATTGGALPFGPPPVAAPAPEESAPAPLGPGTKATVGPDGLAVAPAAAPPLVQQIIAAGNRIAKMPYISGGGHGKWEDAGYDCSGSVSYALHGAGLLDQSMASGGFMTWAQPGAGQWVTTYANAGHMYLVVAGLRFDTSGQRDNGTRWQTAVRTTRGYSIRHPAGL